MAEFIRNSSLIKRKYREFFFPTIVMALSYSLTTIVDGIIVSIFLGADQMASVNTCLPIPQLNATIATLIGVGASTLISISKGRRENQTADSVFTSYFVLLALFTVLLLGSYFVFFEPICHFLSSDKTLSPFVHSYFGMLRWGAFFHIASVSLGYVVSAEGYAKLSSASMISANVLNLLLDILFIRFCGMGISGAAFASVLAFCLQFAILIVLYIFSKKRRTVHFYFKTVFKNSFSVLKTGFSASLGLILVGIKIACINKIVTNIAGPNGMIAFSLCISALSLASLLIDGASDTMMPILGIYHGEGDRHGVKLVFNYALKVLVFSTLALTALLEAFPQLFFFLYKITDETTKSIALPAIRIYAISLIGVSLAFHYLYYFAGTERTLASTIVSTVDGLAVIPFALLLSHFFGIYGVWFSFIAAEILSVAVIAVILLIQRKKEKKAGLKTEMLLEFSFDETQISDAIKKIRPCLTEHRIDSNSANIVTLATEEISVNSVEFTKKSKKKRSAINFDITIKKTDENIALTVCDDGSHFDPTTYKADESAEFRIGHIELLRAMSERISYSYVIGLNKTTVLLNEKK